VAGPEAREQLAQEHLHPNERAVWKRLVSPKRQVEWLGGRLAAKQAVIAQRAQRTAPPGLPAEIEIGQEASGPCQGRPSCRGGPEVSISHSGEHAIAVAAADRIGVDLERLRPVSQTLIDYCTAPGEDLRHLPVLIRWAAKEALLKLAGVGLRGSMRGLWLGRWEVEGDLTWWAESALEPQLEGARLWAGLSRGYALAIAWLPGA
jgi:4'-phosphopantetheinyl transferase